MTAVQRRITWLAYAAVLLTGLIARGVGALVGPVGVGFALRAGLPYGAVFGAGAAAAALVVALLLTTPLVHERGAGATARDKAALLTRPILWVLGGVLFLYIAAEAGV